MSKRKEENLFYEYFDKIDKVTTEDILNSTIIMPDFSPWHFDLIEQIFASYGIKVEHNQATQEDVDYGLRVIHNDMCYPAIIVGGQLLRRVKNSDEKLILAYFQTGGGCRATNYASLIQSQLAEEQNENIKFIKFGFERFEPLKVFFKAIPLTKRLHLANQLYYSILLGDLLMKLEHATRPYEENKGETEEIYTIQQEITIDYLLNSKLNRKSLAKISSQLIEAFEQIARKDVVKPKVGIVGEILVKYQPFANNYINKQIEELGGEAVIPGLTDFINYTVYSKAEMADVFGLSKKTEFVSKRVLNKISKDQEVINRILKNSKYFSPGKSIAQVANYASQQISLANQTGEGWLLAGEILALVDNGVENVACLQPFACLPNHIVGKGMTKYVRQINPSANIHFFDYDPGASKVNQLNRIKLMMNIAKENISK